MKAFTNRFSGVSVVGESVSSRGMASNWSVSNLSVTRLHLSQVRRHEKPFPNHGVPVANLPRTGGSERSAGLQLLHLLGQSGPQVA